MGNYLAKTNNIVEDIFDDRESEIFHSWLRVLIKETFLVDMFSLGVANLRTLGLEVKAVFNFSVSDDFCHQMASTIEPGCPLLSQWLLDHLPQYASVQHSSSNDNKEKFNAILREHNIQSVLLDGFIGEDMSSVLYLSLYHTDGQSKKCDPQKIKEVLALISQHPYIRDNKQSSIKKLSRFSSVEDNIIHWLKKGKTNWEIATILGKSEWTVKTQVQKILQKSAYNSRTDFTNKPLVKWYGVDANSNCSVTLYY